MQQYSNSRIPTGQKQSHIEYQVINEKRELIADSTLSGRRQPQAARPSFGNACGHACAWFIEETHVRRGTSVITAYAQVPIAHTDPAQHWGILIRVDLNDILAPFRSFLWELSVLAILILLPLLGLVLGIDQDSSRRMELHKAGVPAGGRCRNGAQKTDGGPPFAGCGRTEVGIPAGSRRIVAPAPASREGEHRRALCGIRGL